MEIETASLYEPTGLFQVDYDWLQAPNVYTNQYQNIYLFICFNFCINHKYYYAMETFLPTYISAQTLPRSLIFPVGDAKAAFCSVCMHGVNNS